jgi:aldehyde dehydrogenase (NAD+)
VTGFIESGLKQGASLVIGGKRPDHLKKGYFLQPTLFDHIKSEMNIAQKEIFGPVIVAQEFEDDDEAVKISNGVVYGLVAGVYTKDISHALRIAQRLKTGSVWINGWYLGGVQAPTGGTKESGFGRERGLAGIHNYLQVKNIGIRL